MKKVDKKEIYHNRNVFSVTMCVREQRVRVNNNVVINDDLSIEEMKREKVLREVL